MAFVDYFLHQDSAGNAFVNLNDKLGVGITSTLNAGKQSLDVNITGGLSLNLQQVTDFGNTSTNQILLAAQSASTPSYSFTSDANTGMFSPGADTIGWATGGSEWMRLTSAGKLGISQTTPTAWLHLPASTTAASTAPIKLATGTLMTTPEVGAIEFDGTDLYYTKTGPTRLKVVNTTTLAAADGTTFGIASFTAADFNSSAGVISLDYTNGQKASASVPGFLSSADWTTFNNKFNLPALSAGSVLFSNGTTIAQDNSNFFWDDTNNRLGIGTTSPAAALDVNGQIFGKSPVFVPGINYAAAFVTSNNSTAFGVSSDQVNFALQNTSSTANSWTTMQSFTTAGVAGGFGFQHTNISSAYADIAFFNRGTSGFGERLRITSDGYVGIGTSSPVGKFAVSGTTYLGNVDLGATVLNVFANTTGTPLAIQTSAVVNGGSVVAINCGTVSGTVYGLNVSIDCTAAAYFAIQQNGNGGAAMAMTVLGSGDAYALFAVNGVTNWAVGLDNSDSDKYKFSSAGSLGTDDRLTITTTGYVGIGTTSPTGHFHVVGGTAGASTNGVDITLAAQSGGSGNTNGGNIVFTAGAASGAGTTGVITANSHMGVRTAADATYALSVYGIEGLKIAGAGGADAFFTISGDVATLTMTDNSAGFSGSLSHTAGILTFGGYVSTVFHGGVNNSGPGFKIDSGFNGGYELHGFYEGGSGSGRMCLAKQADITNNASCAFNIVSTTHGFGLPAMTTTQRDAISSPKEGLVVMDATTHKLNYYNGSVWVPLTSVGVISVAAGSSTGFAKVGGTLFDHAADANNGTTVETDLYSDTLAASTLGTNNDKVIAEYGGIFVGDATSTQRLKAYVAGTLVFDSGALGIGVTTAYWNLYIRIIRVSSSVVRVTASLNTSFATLNAYAQYTEITGLTLSNTQVVKITGTAAGVTGASNQITAKEGTVSWFPAA